MTQKNWGPFTGNHLTAIAGFILLAIAVPSGLWAADPFSNVAIYDPISGNTAAVDAGSRLLAGDGNGPLTVDGTVAVSSGTILARESLLGDWFRYYKSVDQGNPCQKLVPPSTQLQVVRTFVYNAWPGQTNNQVAIVLGTSTSCQAGSSVLFNLFNLKGAPSIHPISFEPGLIVPVGKALWLVSTGGFNSVTVTGYRAGT